MNTAKKQLFPAKPSTYPSCSRSRTVNKELLWLYYITFKQRTFLNVKARLVGEGWNVN
jgi:hypothetical protein